MPSRVTRRDALRITTVGAVGVAGAARRVADATPRTTEPTTNPPPTLTETPTPVANPGEQLYRTSVVDYGVGEDGPSAADLDFAVRVPDPKITERTTATVVLERENAGDEPIEVGTDPEYPLPQYSSNVEESGALGAVLVSSGTHDLDATEPGCWGLAPLAVIFPGNTMLGPGESITVTYEVWAEPTEERQCLQPGTYSFEELLVTWTLRIAEA